MREYPRIIVTCRLLRDKRWGNWSLWYNFNIHNFTS